MAFISQNSRGSITAVSFGPGRYYVGDLGIYLCDQFFAEIWGCKYHFTPGYFPEGFCIFETDTAYALCWTPDDKWAFRIRYGQLGVADRDLLPTTADDDTLLDYGQLWEVKDRLVFGRDAASGMFMFHYDGYDGILDTRHPYAGPPLPGLEAPADTPVDPAAQIAAISHNLEAQIAAHPGLADALVQVAEGSAAAEESAAQDHPAAGQADEDFDIFVHIDNLLTRAREANDGLVPDISPWLPEVDCRFVQAIKLARHAAPQLFAPPAENLSDPRYRVYLQTRPEVYEKLVMATPQAQQAAERALTAPAVQA